MIRKPPLSATLCALAGIAVLCSLGTWQLHRLEWKTDLLQKLQAEYDENAQPALLKPADLKQDFTFRRGTLRGRYDFDKQILEGLYSYERLPGHHVITPLALSDGSFILVDRGWVPQSWKSTDEVNRPAGTVSITGLLRKPSSPNPFRPDNEPENDRWYYVDLAQIATAKNLQRLHPYVLHLEESGGPMTDYPAAHSARPELANDHFHYAIFWFAMAGTLAVVFTLRFMRKTSG